ncbi:hypothetical protein RR48_03481, partial [Papilio machaon]
INSILFLQGSLLVRRSLLRPNGMEPCYTCRAEDKPWSHTLLQFCGKLKDMMTRAINAIASTTRIQKIN